MKNPAACLLLVVGLFALPSLAFADAQTIDFSCIMRYQHPCFDCLILHPEDDDFTREGGLGILDMAEMELLSLILADPAAPQHDEIHAAFKTNSELVRAAANPFLLNWTTPTATTGDTARQPIPNTDPQLYYGADATLGAYITMGEWDYYMEALQAWVYGPFGSGTTVPASPVGYVLLPMMLSMLGDVDADSEMNCSEYWATSPPSWTGALDPEVQEAGGVWNVWTLRSAVHVDSIKFAYNPATQRVYVLPNHKMPWQSVQNMGYLGWWGKYPLLMSPVAIRNSGEQTFVDSLIEDGTYVWLGCTDAGRDTGHSAPNPQDWYWLSDPSQSPMTYAAWNYGQPDGVDGAADCAVMRGSQDGGFAGSVPATWYDMSEYDGAPLLPRMYPAIFELDSLFPDDDSNGVPDAFENGALNTGDLCLTEDLFMQEGSSLNEVLMRMDAPSADLKATLTALGMTTWETWDIEGIEANLPPATPSSAGDGLPDSAQLALMEYVACSPWMEAHELVSEGMETNWRLWHHDLFELMCYDYSCGFLWTYQNVFPALIGSSQEMKDTIDSLFSLFPDGAEHLPSYAEYIVFSNAKGGPLFSANGDLDGDGKTNLTEYNEVVAAGKGIDTFIEAATDPYNLWYGAPGLPVAGLLASGLLAGSLLAGAALVLRKK